jgi:hypothetical protein
MTLISLRQRSIPALNGLVVSAYKAMGFVVLTVLLLGLASFILLSSFFYANRTWVAPIVISQTDERVLAVTAQLAQQMTLRDKLNAERAELEARMVEADRNILSTELYGQEFRAVADAELAARRAELRQIETLRADFSARRAGIARSNREFSRVSKSRAEELLAARLVDSDTYASVGHQLSQVAKDEISLAQTQVQIDSRITILNRDIEALQGVVRGLGASPGSGHSGNVSYDVLKMKEDYTQKSAQQAKAHSDRDVIAQALAVNANSMARYDKLIATTRESPFLQATNENVFVAFVPYDNLDKVGKGVSLYGCHMGVALCRRVGEVVELMAGEVSGQQPMSRQSERGLLVRINLDTPSWAKERVLFVGRAPLFM